MDFLQLELKQVELPFGKIIYQSKYGQGISSETAELISELLKHEERADFRVLELGSGIGIMSLMLKHYRQSWSISGIEIQKHLVEISQENSRLAEENVNFYEADLRTYSEIDKFDLIVTNPPYYKVNESRISPSKERAIARHELLCKMSDVIAAIRRNLSNCGRAYLLYPQNREEELLEVVGTMNMKLDKIREVSSLKKNRVIIYRIELK